MWPAKNNKKYNVTDAKKQKVNNAEISLKIFSVITPYQGK